MQQLPPKAELEALLEYESQSGLLWWRHRPESSFRDGKMGLTAAGIARRWNEAYAGREAFQTICCSAGGRCPYKKGRLLGRDELAHRVIWKLVTGENPVCIDHIDGNTLNNRIENLRNVTQRENSRNSPRRKDNKSGHPGIRSRNGRWQARIGGGSHQNLGCFSTFDDALAARKAAENDLGYHSNHGRVTA